MSSPRTGVLSLIRFDLGMCKTKGGGPCDFSVSPSPFGLDFGLWDFGFGLDKKPGNFPTFQSINNHTFLSSLRRKEKKLTCTFMVIHGFN